MEVQLAAMLIDSAHVALKQRKEAFDRTDMRVFA